MGKGSFPILWRRYPNLSSCLSEKRLLTTFVEGLLVPINFLSFGLPQVNLPFYSFQLIRHLLQTVYRRYTGRLNSAYQLIVVSDGLVTEESGYRTTGSTFRFLWMIIESGSYLIENNLYNTEFLTNYL